MKAKHLFHVLLTSVMLAATAGLTAACTSNDDNPATPSGPSESVIKEKILGKWKRVKEDGEERVTNNRVVLTYFADGKMTYSRSSYSDYWTGYKWYNENPFTYVVSGNVVTREGVEENGRVRKTFDEVAVLSDSEMKLICTGYLMDGQSYSRYKVNEFKRVAVDYSEDIIGTWEGVEMTGDETYGNADARIAYLPDGTYRYYQKNSEGEWEVKAGQELSEYNVDGDWLATRWQEKGGEMNYEWWDIDEIKDGQMKWSALREREDGTRFKTTFMWKKVDDIAFLIDEEHFPDATLRKKLTTPVYHIKGDYSQTYNFGDDGVITTEELEKVDGLYIGYSNIENLEGIELFSELTQLTCLQTSVKTFNLKLPKLESLDCSDSKLTKIDMSGCPELKVLYCKHSNSLESIDLSKNTKLQNLDCESCALTTLDVSKCTELMQLRCAENILSTVNVSNLSKLKALDIYGNPISALNISGCESLNWLIITLNQLQGEALDTVIANLPLKTESLGTFSVMNDLSESVITETQIAAANDRGWTVQIGSEQYPGTLVSE